MSPPEAPNSVHRDIRIDFHESRGHLLRVAQILERQSWLVDSVVVERREDGATMVVSAHGPQDRFAHVLKLLARLVDTVDAHELERVSERREATILSIHRSPGMGRDERSAADELDGPREAVVASRRVVARAPGAVDTMGAV